MSKKLLLIQAAETQPYLCMNSAFTMPPLALGIIAALTPDDWEVTIVDEAVGHLSPEQLGGDWAAVGIGAATPAANRAYRLGRAFRDRGIPVVLGGIHVSALPEEPFALGCADAVVIGEVEAVWEKILRDIEAGTVRRTYCEPTRSLVGLPMPRRDLFADGYAMDGLQASRGCPYLCEFCPGKTLYPQGYRQRPFREVLDEWAELRRPRTYVVDDCFFGHTPKHMIRSIELCKGKKDRGIETPWVSMVSVNATLSSEAMQAMAASGGRVVLVGMESLDANVLARMNKAVNLDFAERVANGNVEQAFKMAIRRFHDHGIAVIGSFIFGYDEDPEDVGSGIGQFLMDSEIDGYAYFVLRPFPGTAYAHRAQEEGRLLLTDFPGDWSRYGGKDPVVRGRRSAGDLFRQIEKSLYLGRASLLGSHAVARTASIAGRESAEFCRSWNENNEAARKLLSRPTGEATLVGP